MPSIVGSLKSGGLWALCRVGGPELSPPRLTAACDSEVRDWPPSCSRCGIVPVSGVFRILVQLRLCLHLQRTQDSHEMTGRIYSFAVVLTTRGRNSNRRGRPLLEDHARHGL